MPGKIAYVMSRFPHLPETFILREMSEMERNGWHVYLYPLIYQRQEIIHDLAKEWVVRAHQASDFSFSLLLENIKVFFRNPGNYMSLLVACIWKNRFSLNFLIRAMVLFPKAVLFSQIMKKEGIEHIHAHYASHPGLVAWLIHRLTGISYSITVHAHDIFVRTAMLYTKLEEAAFVISISNYNREYLARILGPWVNEKTHIIHCGIDPALYEPSLPYDREIDRFEIVSIGSLQPYKGHELLIKACGLLQNQGIPIRCRIIGGGKEQSKLEKLIRQLDLESSVLLLGPKTQEDVSKLLPTAHCYVQPSIITSSGKMEGIPVSLMEAMACELPVVATSISGIPELVRPGLTGWLVPPGDEVALAEAIKAIYKNPGMSKEIGRAGKELVIQEYLLSANVEKLALKFKCIFEQKQRLLTVYAMD